MIYEENKELGKNKIQWLIAPFVDYMIGYSCTSSWTCWCNMKISNIEIPIVANNKVD